MAARVLFAVLVLPVTVVVVAPLWIAARWDVPLVAPGSPGGWLLAVVGGLVLSVGGALFGACLWRFVREGRGTLGPWDPPVELVVGGPYAHVRHPMISAVVLLLLSEAMLLRSGPHLAWAALFAGFNAAYLPLVEEPGLRRRFGAAYDEYAAHVPRLIPRVTPWTRP